MVIGKISQPLLPSCLRTTLVYCENADFGDVAVNGGNDRRRMVNEMRWPEYVSMLGHRYNIVMVSNALQLQGFHYGVCFVQGCGGS